MNNKIIGIVLVIVGVALGVWGYDVYDAASSQISRVLSGDSPMEAWVGMIGGAVCVLLGVFKLN